jgi:hypothetical protein
MSFPRLFGSIDQSPMRYHASGCEDDPGLASMTMNVLETLEVIIDPERVVRTQPFKHHLARRKHDSNRYSTDTADPTGVFITQQVKHP